MIPCVFEFLQMTCFVPWVCPQLARVRVCTIGLELGRKRYLPLQAIYFYMLKYFVEWVFKEVLIPWSILVHTQIMTAARKYSYSRASVILGHDTRVEISFAFDVLISKRIWHQDADRTKACKFSQRVNNPLNRITLGWARKHDVFTFDLQSLTQINPKVQTEKHQLW